MEKGKRNDKVFITGHESLALASGERINKWELKRKVRTIQGIKKGYCV